MYRKENERMYGEMVAWMYRIRNTKNTRELEAKKKADRDEIVHRD